MQTQSEKTGVQLMEYPDELEASWEPGNPWYNYQLSEHGGLGLMTQYGAKNEINHEACEFITQQIGNRLIPGYFPEADVVEWAYNFAYYAVDQIDPYMFFHGYTDVVRSDEALYYQFEIREELTDDFREISADHAEFYKIFPKGATKNFPIIYQDIDEKRGLLQNFDTIHDYFHDHISMLKDEMHEDYYPDEIKFIRRYGFDATVTLLEKAVWSALIWMISPEPESRAWRYNFHPIFEVVYDHQSCLLDEWTFYRPGYFKMSERPLGSCAKCGTTDWCVELLQGKGKTEYVCQSCQSDKKPFPGMTCGTKMCTAIKCPNHPAHEYADSALGNRKVRQIEAETRYGPLQQLPNGMQVRETPGIIYVNRAAIERTTRSIADQVGNAFTALLEESFK